MVLGGFVNSKRIISLFLSGFLLIGSWCYAGDPQASALQSSPATVVAIPVKASATGQWSDGWYEGASGYDKGVEEYRQTNKPMLVYMSVGWCPYCRRFEKDVLSSPIVQDVLKDKIKVHINPPGDFSNQLSHATHARRLIMTVPAWNVGVNRPINVPLGKIPGNENKANANKIGRRLFRKGSPDSLCARYVVISQTKTA